MTLQHVVLFHLPPDRPEADPAVLERTIAEWVGQIPNLQRLRLGRDITGGRHRGFEYLMYMEFDDMEDLQRYRDHPAHLKFGEWVRSVGCQTLVVDYMLDDSTVLM